MKTCTFLVGLVLALNQSPQHAGEMNHHDLPVEKLGQVSFPISCAPEAQEPFELGVVLLHSYWYEEVRSNS